MAVFRTHRLNNFTTVNNYLIRDENLTLKDKGMMVVLLSLPETWEYSVLGLETICKESKNTINDILNNLEKYEYLERGKVRDEKGRFKEWKYDIYEIPKTKYEEEYPHPKKQDMEKRDMENPYLENSPQLIKEELNTKKLNKDFIPPTLEDIKDYCLNVRHNSVDYQKFYDYYTAGNWKDSKGNKIKNWKQKVITWEKKDRKEFDYEYL